MDSPDPSDDRLDLLLVDADERQPVFQQGLPTETSQQGPRPKKPPMPHWERTDADPNDLALQRWAVIACEGPEGDQQLEAMAPLIRLREEEQGAPARIYRVPPDLSAKQSAEWKDNVHSAEDVPVEERPRYLLMLGDLHQTSAELQHTLANSTLVGRFHATNQDGETSLDGYAAYAAKAARWAREAPRESAAALRFFSAPDGTSATHTGRVRLMEPSLSESTQKQAQGKLPVASVGELKAETVEGLLEAGAGASPTVLLSLSHGLGAPRRGWASEAEQWRSQGALMINRDEVLDAERLKGRAFLPGGMWFYLACFGAGTPSSSAYHTWLQQLSAASAFKGSVDAVLKSLPGPGQRPFLAALPQAALANPQGPLAVLAHLDLAWTYGFSGSAKLAEGRKSRLFNTLKMMVRGSRAGVALDGLMVFYRETNNALMAGYELEANARANGRPDPTDRVERGHQWMLRNDLRGYVLLGDPAARLPLGQHPVSDAMPPPAPLQPSSPGKTMTRAEAVQALLRGDQAPATLARRAQVSLETLWDEVEAYRAGVRARNGR